MILILDLLIFINPPALSSIVVAAKALCLSFAHKESFSERH
jgi:hypothetical protein